MRPTRSAARRLTAAHLRVLALTTAATLLSACAAVVPSVETRLAPAAGPADHRIVVEQPASIQLSTGYRRELEAKSRWQSVGTLQQGTVYRPLGGVFSIEGRDVHEAYLVIQNGRLHGFYLPAESRFSPLDPPLALSIGATQ